MSKPIVDHAMEYPDALVGGMSVDHDIPTEEGTKSSGDGPPRVDHCNDEKVRAEEGTKSSGDDPTRVDHYNYDEEFAYNYGEFAYQGCTNSSSYDNDAAQDGNDVAQGGNDVAQGGNDVAQGGDIAKGVKPERLTRRRVPDELQLEKNVNQCYVEERLTNKDVHLWRQSLGTVHRPGNGSRLAGLIKVHDARKQAHTIKTEYISHVSEMLLESMEKESMSDSITIMCVKDRGGGNKECKRRIPLNSFIETLLWHRENEPEEQSREDCSSVINRLEGAAMSLNLLDCRENRHTRGRALFAICPRPGCECAEGFEIHFSYRTDGHSIRCPIEGCITNGQPTWWCSMCETVHMPGAYCPLPDPRERMTTDELAQHQAMVDAGEEQWCRCGTPYGKDNGCASVTCKKPSCKYHFCFGCGGELDEDYMSNHLMYGPGDLGWGCCKTFVIKAFKDHAGMREFISRSLNCDNLRRAIGDVVNDRNIQITEEQREWIRSIVQVNIP